MLAIDCVLIYSMSCEHSNLTKYFLDPKSPNL